MYDSTHTDDGFGGIGRDSVRVNHNTVDELTTDEYADAILSSEMPEVSAEARLYDLQYSLTGLKDVIHTLTLLGAPSELLESAWETAGWIGSQVDKYKLGE